MNTRIVGTTKRSSGRNAEAGFSVIELLVSTGLFIIVMGAVFGLMAVARADRHTVNQRVESMQTVRNALNSVGRDALNTGYKYRTIGSFFPDNIHNTVFGLTADANNTPDSMMQVLSGNNVNTNSLNPTAGLKTDQITFIYGDETFNSGQTLDVRWVDCDGEQVIVTWPTTLPTPVPAPSPWPTPTPSLPVANDLVIITGGNSSAIGMVTGTVNGGPPAGTVTSCGSYAVPGNTTVRTIQFVSTDLLGMNKTGASNIIKNVTPLATLSRVKLATYRVLNDGTLVRTEYGNFTPGGKQDMPLAYNVEDLQIKYVLTDGTLLDDPAAGVDGIFGNGDDTPDNMENVRQVRITVTARSPEKDKNGNYFKVTLSSTFNTRNIGYDAQ